MKGLDTQNSFGKESGKNSSIICALLKKMFHLFFL